MRKFGILAVSITLCLSIAFIFPHSGKSFITFIDGCSACHGGSTVHDGHDFLLCNTCHNAHNGAMAGIMPSPSKCITCHPLGNPAKCNLVDYHELPEVDANCSICHTDCDFGTASVVDSDNDGIADDVDNCPSQANGPEGGTCSNATMGEPCVKNGDCGCEGYCSMDQEDTDEDGIGDVCDN